MSSTLDPKGYSAHLVTPKIIYLVVLGAKHYTRTWKHKVEQDRKSPWPHGKWTMKENKTAKQVTVISINIMEETENTPEESKVESPNPEVVFKFKTWTGAVK